MFKWKKKTHGCNCTPMSKGAVSYLLNIGNLYQGEVKFDPEFDSWGGEVFVCNRSLTGKRGGGHNRDYYMDFGVKS